MEREGICGWGVSNLVLDKGKGEWWRTMLAGSPRFPSWYESR